MFRLNNNLATETTFPDASTGGLKLLENPSVILLLD